MGRISYPQPQSKGPKCKGKEATQYLKARSSKVIRFHRKPSALSSTARRMSAATSDTPLSGHEQHGQEWEDVMEEEMQADCDPDPCSTTTNIIEPQVFMKFPLELREMVYENVMADVSTELVIKDKKPKDSPLSFCARFLPAVAFMNHQSFAEATLVYLRRTTIIIEENHYGNRNLMTLLSHLPHDQIIPNIHSLVYPARMFRFTRPYDETYAKYRPYISFCMELFILRCTALRDLTLVIPAGMLIIRGGSPRLKTTQEAEETLGLSPLLAHKGLRRLKLLCVDGSTYIRKVGLQSGQQLFEGFVEAFKNEIKRRGGRMQVTWEIRERYPF